MRAWLFFLGYSLRRQTRARLLVVVSLALLGLVALLVHLTSPYWSLADLRVPVGPPPKGQSKPERAPLGQAMFVIAAPTRLPMAPENSAGAFAVIAAVRAAMVEGAAPRIFTGAIVVGLLATLLMPLWTLTFANESLGRARETRTLTWLLLRPLPRWSTYLACYLSALPGALLLNLGGYVIFCLLAGAAGRIALPLYGLPVLLGTLAFTAFFQFLSVSFQRAAIVGLLYVFFFEMVASNLPGQQKRLSISYYVRCLILNRAREADIAIELSGTNPVVDGTTSIAVLVAATIGLIVAGMIVFSRKQYVENAASA